MIKKEFLLEYILTGFLAAAGAAGLIHVLDLWEQSTLCWVLFFIFLMLMPWIYRFAHILAGGKNLNQFTQFALLLSFSKLAITAIILVIFFTKDDSLSTNLAWPYLYIYLVFTIFETRMMMKQGKV